MNIAIVLAGGVGSRSGLDFPKQFYRIKDKEVLAYTLTEFENSSKIDRIIVVSLGQYFEKIADIVEKYEIRKYLKTVENGKTRQESVLNALKSLEDMASRDDIIVIHDGIRAMIKSRMIDVCVEETRRYKATTLAQKSINTIVLSKSGIIKEYIDRNYVYNIQTPQSFEYGIIYDAHKKAESRADFTDDTQIVIKNGIDVHIIENDEPNLKLTTKEDLKLFEFYLGLV